MTLSALVDDLRSLVIKVTNEMYNEASTISDKDLDQAVAVLWQASDRLNVALTKSIGQWDERGRFRSDGSRTPAVRLERDFSCSRHTARQVVRRARFLGRHHLVDASFAAGALTTDKVDALVRAAGSGRGDLFAHSESELVADAEKMGHADLHQALGYWILGADEKLGQDRKGTPHGGRRLNLIRTLDGAIRLSGLLDPVAGTIFADEIERVANDLFREDWAIARSQFGPEATPDQLPRTAAQRSADALRIVATRSASPAGKDGQRTPRPLFTVEVDQATALHICQLADGTPIDPESLVPWVTQADVERVVFDTPARVLEVGRRRRFFRGALRRAIELRDKHCTFPGCDVPAAQCDIDHVVEYADGGLTTQENGRLRCPAHNRQRPGRRDSQATAGPKPSSGTSNGSDAFGANDDRDGPDSNNSTPSSESATHRAAA